MSEKTGNNQPTASATPALSDRVRSLRLSNQVSSGSRRPWLPWSLCVLLLITTTVFAFRSAQPAADTGKGSGSSDRPTADSQGVVLESKGNIIAAHLIQISPQVGGEIIWLDPNFNEGTVYKRGNKLAVIYPDIYKAQLDSFQHLREQAVTNLEQVETGSALQEIEAAEAQLDNLEAKVELSDVDVRDKRKAGTATSRDDMDKAIAQLKADQHAHRSQKKTVERLKVSLKERRDMAKAQLSKADADVVQAKENLKNCTIIAPVDGVILTKKAEEHGYVNPFAFGAAGYLCEMADLTDLEVELFIQERDIANVRVGQQCRVVPDAHKERTYNGYVSRIMPTADRAKGAIPVRVKLARLQLDGDSLASLQKDLAKADPPAPETLVSQLQTLKDRDFDSETAMVEELKKIFNDKELRAYKPLVVARALKTSVPRSEEGIFLKPDMSVIVSFLK
jgi:HlyD family secretion protein